MNAPTVLQDAEYQNALSAVQRTLDKLKGCSPEEKHRLQGDFQQLQDLLKKLTTGRVEIVVFGEISTGKSALINALLGESVADVDVQGGWTKEVAESQWRGCVYQLPGFADSHVVLIDTPGINEVQGEIRGRMAREAAQRSDLILFVTDSDLNEIEHAALLQLVSLHKPLIVVLNKADLYSPPQRERLLQVLRDERLRELLPAEQIVLTSADPREVEYVIESADGRTRSEWRKPPPNVEDLKLRILQILEREGLALVTLSAAMFASDKSDRIATLRVQLRETRANQVIMSYAVVKAVAVALNPVGVVDVLGGSAVDVTMVVTLASIYGLDLSWAHARSLVKSILSAAGLVMLGEAFVHISSSAFKTLTLGAGTLLTALPQGAAAGFGSYIVGHAAKYYFEHGSSWGREGPKRVVKRILETTDKQSVLQHLKQEIQKRLLHNPHAAKEEPRK